MLDYTGFYEFPFPTVLAENDLPKKEYFFSLPDEDQLKILNDSDSYENFIQHLENNMRCS